MGKMMKQNNLSEILDSLDIFSWQDELFAKAPDTIELDSICYVLDVDETEQIEENDSITINNKSTCSKYFLSIHDIRMIITNLKFYQPNPSVQEILTALRYYFEHNAYGPHNP